MKIPERQPELRQQIDSAPVQDRGSDEDQRRSAYIPRPVHGSATATRKKIKFPLAVICGVALVGLAIGAVWISGKHGPAHNVSPKPALNAAVQKTFYIHAADVSSSATAEAKALLAAASTVTVDQPSLDSGNTGQKPSPSVATALATLSPQQRQEIVSGDRLFYKVVLFDNQIQDGDAVEVFFNGKSLGVVSLTNRGMELTVPLKSGEPARLTCRAVKDGDGGGVTFGARSSSGEERSRVMDVGESETWNINVQ